MGKSKTADTSVSTKTKTTLPKTAGKTRKPKVVTPPSELKFNYPRLPRAPLLRMVKDMAKAIDKDARVQANLLDRVEQIVQDTVADLIKSTVLAAQQHNRKTMMVKDLDFIIDLRSGKATTPGSVMNVYNSASTSAPTAVVAASSN
jgi:histone H3/H4